MTAKNHNEGPSQEGGGARNLSIQGSVGESNLVVGDHNTIYEGPKYYTTNVFSSLDVVQFPVRPSQPLSREEYRWRQVLVQNVKHYWIEGVLERSLYKQSLIELGLEERGQAVASSISGSEEFVKETKQPFPEGTQAIDIFDKLGAGRTLLILGDAGAGKTTTLLKLAKTLMTRIGEDFSQPIPVILNLSSWAKKRKPIAEWLVQDLYETLQVSKALGITWIQEEQLTLCLDGLDEVVAEHRNACLQALNHFLQNHGRTEVVVCSRVRDYEALSERLRVRCAIFVQPLTAQQVDQYLEKSGKQLSALRTICSHNPEIREFAISPLILSVMSLAYQGYSLDEFPEIGSVQSFQQRLFDTYIERMFLRRGKPHDYTEQQTKHWLAWLAQQMAQTSQTIFFIEAMQSSWFPYRTQRLRYQLESSLIVGLGAGLSAGLSAGLVSGFINGLRDQWIGISGWEVGLRAGLDTGLRTGLIFGAIFGLVALTLKEITPVETLKWSWKKAKKSLYSGLVLGLMSGMILGVILRVDSTLIGDLIYGSFFGLSGGLIYGLIGGLSGPEMTRKIKPNQGIWKSARNAGVCTLLGGLVSGLVVGIIDELFLGLVLGILGGLIAGLSGGGSACLRHFSLRFRLYLLGYSPWNYARFLNYATERLFLQKVGGGYMFIHRMLLEHFSKMKLEQHYSK